MSKGIFITATGTDVGKTYVTALLVKKLRESGICAGYYKAALSGAEYCNGRLVPGDAQYVCRMAGIEEEPEQLVSYFYETAVSPHLAAVIHKQPIEKEVILQDFRKVKERYDYITVEGSGGIICPLRMDEKKLMLEDVIKMLYLDVLIVAPAGLGTINSTILTVEYARQKGIEVKGIILNGYEPDNVMHKDNKNQIEVLSAVPVIACVENNAEEINIALECLLDVYGEVS
ncbi:dethiobiotin synthase [Anaeromicropila populeti]|uniref:ATP-dependent dethiobiotin synthetase BioD n=1 Tax=Anaeromicropila populeti TaxID=37658 RepID=A0A1I6JWM3_9FIRM|nr:dethiobiotin synthase [Anaeromicropila populeti]SFR83389.1 dethiobiotin synthase [Anaeromicropila populeti]